MTVDARNLAGGDSGIVQASKPGADAGPLGDLLDLLERGRPAWHADAACRERPDVNFFPGLGQTTEPARAVCAACLVQEECRAYALAAPRNPPLSGIWGGTSSRERQKIRASNRPRTTRPAMELRRTPEFVADARALYGDGVTIGDIATRLGVHYNTVRRALRSTGSAA